MKIHRYNENGFIYYEAIGKDCNLFAFSIRELINQLFVIYSIDFRRYLFNAPNFSVVNHSQLN